MFTRQTLLQACLAGVKSFLFDFLMPKDFPAIAQDPLPKETEKGVATIASQKMLPAGNWLVKLVGCNVIHRSHWRLNVLPSQKYKYVYFYFRLIMLRALAISEPQICRESNIQWITPLVTLIAGPAPFPEQGFKTSCCGRTPAKQNYCSSPAKLYVPNDCTYKLEKNTEISFGATHVIRHCTVDFIANKARFMQQLYAQSMFQSAALPNPRLTLKQILLSEHVVECSTSGICIICGNTANSGTGHPLCREHANKVRSLPDAA